MNPNNNQVDSPNRGNNPKPPKDGQDSTYTPTNIYPSPSVTPTGYNPYHRVHNTPSYPPQPPFASYPTQPPHSSLPPGPNNMHHHQGYQAHPVYPMPYPHMTAQPMNITSPNHPPHQTPPYPPPGAAQGYLQPAAASSPPLAVPHLHTAAAMNRSLRRWVSIMLVGAVFITITYIIAVFISIMSEVAPVFPVLSVISTIIFGGILVYSALRSNNVYNSTVSKYPNVTGGMMSPRSGPELEAASQLPSPSYAPLRGNLSYPSVAEQHSKSLFLQALDYLRGIEPSLNMVRTFAILHGIFPLGLIFLYILGLSSGIDDELVLPFFTPLLLGVGSQICLSVVAYKLFNSIRLRKPTMEAELKRFNNQQNQLQSQQLYSGYTPLTSSSQANTPHAHSGADMPPAGFTNQLV